MPYANLKIGLGEFERDDLIAQVKAIEASMHYLIQLTPKERKSHFRMGKKAPYFFDTALLIAKQHPTILPNYFNLPDFEEDVTDFKMLTNVLSHITKLARGVQDTITAVEQESMRASRNIYKHCQAASVQNVQGMQEALALLSPMMPKTGKTKKKKVPIE